MITDKDREDAKIICSAIKIPIELSVGGLKIVTTVSTGEILAKLNSETIAQIVYGIRAESAEQARKQHEKEMLDEIKQRDSAEGFIDKLLDLLDVEHEWSNIFGYDEAYREAESELDQIRSFSAYEARQQARKESAERVCKRCPFGTCEDKDFCRVRASILGYSVVIEPLTSDGDWRESLGRRPK